MFIYEGYCKEISYWLPPIQSMQMLINTNIHSTVESSCASPKRPKSKAKKKLPDTKKKTTF